MTLENISQSISTKECCRPRGRGWTCDLQVSTRTAHPTQPPRLAVLVLQGWKFQKIPILKSNVSNIKNSFFSLLFFFFNRIQYYYWKQHPTFPPPPLPTPLPHVLVFLRKMGFTFSYKLSPICMKCQTLLSWKIKKKIISNLSPAILPSMLGINNNSTITLSNKDIMADNKLFSFKRIIFMGESTRKSQYWNLMVPMLKSDFFLLFLWKDKSS